MLYSIHGAVRGKGDNFIILETSGLGFKVFVHRRWLPKAPGIGKEVLLFSHLQVRDTGLELYGFETSGELAFFELLLSVSGVGPKSALALFEVAPLDELMAAIFENRPDLLTKAAGVGRKTAERVVLELKGKIQASQSERTVDRMESDADLVEALVDLGYRREHARAALSKIDRNLSGIEVRLKAALKILGK